MKTPHERIVPWYIGVERFDPSCGQTWHDYVAWSGLTQLEEVVSLDSSLCPDVIGELKEEDWAYNVHEDAAMEFFCDLGYLLKRVGDTANLNILAAVRNPSEECRDAWRDLRFEFQGYDLIGFGMSVLNNCGGFRLAFRNDELTCVGLLPTLTRALEVQGALLQHRPDDGHTDCDIWALWRMKRGT